MIDASMRLTTGILRMIGGLEHHAQTGELSDLAKFSHLLTEFYVQQHW